MAVRIRCLWGDANREMYWREKKKGRKKQGKGRKESKGKGRAADR